jgi:uncharacterized protein (TIGR00369 family)
VNRADAFAPLPDDMKANWETFGGTERQYFSHHLGFVVEEIRRDYCRMRMPFQPLLEQAAGVVHGGAIASLLDSVVVPAIGQAYPPEVRFSTVDMHVQYLSALAQDDAVAEGWIVRRGRSVVFCEAEIIAATSGKIVAKSMLTYNVSMP